MIWHAGDVVSVTGHEFAMDISPQTIWGYRLNATVILKERLPLTKLVIL